jgi:hypothetical protein
MNIEILTQWFRDGPYLINAHTTDLIQVAADHTLRNTSVRYLELWTVPHDLALGIFRTQDSTQIHSLHLLRNWFQFCLGIAHFSREKKKQTCVPKDYTYGK